MRSSAENIDNNSGFDRHLDQTGYIESYLLLCTAN